MPSTRKRVCFGAGRCAKVFALVPRGSGSTAIPTVRTAAYRFENYNTYSMDEPVPGADDDDEEMTKHDILSDGTPLFADIIADVDQMQALLDRIREIMPEAIQMGELRLQGQTDAVIAETLGIPRTTLLSRLKKLRKALDSEMSDIF